MTTTRRRTPTMSALFLALLLAPLSRVAAQPATAGVPVTSTHFGDELNPTVVAAVVRVVPGHATEEVEPALFSDHEGGAFVGFVADGTLGVVRLDGQGVPSTGWLQTLVGLLRIASPSGTRMAMLRPGVVITGSDLFFPGHGYYWLRPFSGSGPTVPDSSLMNDISAEGPTLVEDPEGGILAISPAVLGGVTQFYTAPVSATMGFVQGIFTATPGTITSIPYWGLVLDAIPAESGGAWAVMEVYDISSGSGRDLVATRLLANGHGALTPSSRVLSSAIRDQRSPALASDGAGGVYVAWQDLRTFSTVDDIYATHLLSDGSLATGWTAGGKPVAAVAGSQIIPAAAPDASGGVWIAWIDARSGENDVYFTHLLGNGSAAAGFPAGGRALCAATGSQIDVHISADGIGGFFALWLDQRDGEIDLYGQHIAGDGSVVPGWVADGLPICTEPSAQSSPRVLTTAFDRAIAVWTDSREGALHLYSTLLAADQTVSVAPAAATRLSLRPASASGHAAVVLWLDTAEPGEVEVALFDVGGRRMAARTLVGPTEHSEVRFDGVPPGLYFAVARQRGAGASARVAVIR